MNAFENIHRLLATACEQHEIGMAELCRYHQRLREFWPNMRAAAFRTRPITRRKFSTTRSTSAFRR
jgi:hypothetical protein